MEQEDPQSRQRWERLAKVFFRPPAPPTPRETEAFVSRVMSRLPQPAPQPSVPAWSWAVPALSFGMAAALFVFWPAPESGPAEVLLLSESRSSALSEIIAGSEEVSPDDILASALE